MFTRVMLITVLRKRMIRIYTWPLKLPTISSITKAGFKTCLVSRDDKLKYTLFLKYVLDLSGKINLNFHSDREILKFVYFKMMILLSIFFKFLFHKNN